MIARVKAEVDADIEKASDMNHSKKSLGRNLDTLANRLKPSPLTVNVRNYITKCFSYAVHQNKGDPNGLAKALRSITPHSFGDHSTCDISWCGYLQKCGPNLEGATPYKHSGLKDGKDLDKGKNPDLFTGLSDILENFAKNSVKLAPVGSIQCNESLHSTIRTKTTKRIHYGDSAQYDRAMHLSEQCGLFLCEECFRRPPSSCGSIY